ncbi:copia protein [Tanacetum coccineum]
MMGNVALLCNFVEKYLGTVHFGNDQFAPILGYGDLVQGNITIKRVYLSKFSIHNFSQLGHFCDADLEVCISKIYVFCCDLQGNDDYPPHQLKDGYWHRRLSHLNFYLLQLAFKEDIVIGLPKLKYVKDQNYVPLVKGTEFLNKTLNALFKEEGIEHQTSTPRIPELTGVVERRKPPLSLRLPLTKRFMFEHQRIRWIPDNQTKVLPLRKALYGLKQAPRAWYDELSKFLISKGFTKGLQIHQSHETQDIVQAVIGLIVQKDIKQGDRLKNTSKRFKKVLFDTLRGTIQMGLWYPKGFWSFDLNSFFRMRSAVALHTRKSTSRGIQFLGDKLVSWMSKKQDCTAMSSVEAEYVALSASCSQVMWMRTQLQDLWLHYNKIPLTEYQLADMFTKALRRKVSVSHPNWYEMFDSRRTGGSDKKDLLDTSSNINFPSPYALSWKPCQGDSLNLPDHRIHKDGDGDASFQLKSDSLPHAHAQTTKTFYKHQDSRIMKAQELKTKTSAQTLIYKIFLQRYQVYQGRLLASFQDDAKYEHVGQDTRSQGGKDDQDKRIKI